MFFKCIVIQVIKHSDKLLEVLLCLNTSGMTADEIIQSFDKAIRQNIPNQIEIKYSVVSQLEPDPRTGKVKDFKDISK